MTTLLLWITTVVLSGKKSCGPFPYLAVDCKQFEVNAMRLAITSFVCSFRDCYATFVMACCWAMLVEFKRSTTTNASMFNM